MFRLTIKEQSHIYFMLSCLTLSHMNLQGFLGVLKRMAFWAAVSECVWIVFAFNVVSNIDNSLVGELQADTTGWHPAVIADHKFDEFFWARESSLKERQSVSNVLLQSSFTLAGMVLQRLF